jgi:hypothetical protein
MSAERINGPSVMPYSVFTTQLTDALGPTGDVAEPHVPIDELGDSLAVGEMLVRFEGLAGEHDQIWTHRGLTLHMLYELYLQARVAGSTTAQTGDRR